MSWLFSQALVEEYLAGNFLDGEQSAPLNGSHTQQAYCAPDKMTKFSHLSQFGMTYKPLTESRGEELLMSYLEAFRAKICQPRGGGAGLDGERSGLWKEMGRIIGEVRPRYVFVENSPMLVNNGLDRVLADLSKLGFDARWGIVGADYVGAPHRRERFWLVANSRSFRLHDGSNKRHNLYRQKICENKSQNWHGVWSEANKCLSTDDWKSFASEFLGVDDGMASRLDRVKACGNGQVPEVAAIAWNILSERI
jgi:DNA (cytosine-5)-methyltransferase 1